MIRTAALAVLFLIAAACERRPDTPPAQPMEGTGPEQANPVDPGVTLRAPLDSLAIELVGTDGSATGTALLSRSDGGVRIAVRVSGLTPGQHGFHIHENGRCDPPSFESAGSHFAPLDRQHGLEHPQGPHAGDLPNLRAGADGTADTTFVASTLTFDSDAQHSLIRETGTALVVHARPDDYRSQPSGDAGDRVACGVLRPH